MSAKYTLRVRCATWDSLESFYRDRIRPGALLGARVPFVPQRGDQVTVALELPDDIVIAIDGVVRELGETSAGKTPIMLRLVGFDGQTIERLEQMVREGRETDFAAESPDKHKTMPRSPSRGRRSSARPPPPTPEDAPVDIALPPLAVPDGRSLTGDALALHTELHAELLRLRELGARDVVGVDGQAAPERVRAAYFKLVRRYHPDSVAKFRSAALTHAASELSIFVNRAYDRVRSAVRAAGGAAMVGPAMRPELGWLIDIGDIEMASTPPSSRSRPGFRVRLSTADSTADAAPTTSETPSQPVRQRRARLTAEILFDDVSAHGDGSEPGRAAIASQSLQEEPAGGTSLSDLVAEAASAAERGDLEQASQLFANALTIDPRDRKLRARYHTARGRQLLAAGDRVRATTQLEIALTHDPDSRDAQSALESLRASGGRKRRFSGWFKR